MAARKGQNNFHKHQQEKVVNNLKLIESWIKTIPRGIKFKDEHAVIRYIAERTTLSRSTIRRNPKYMVAILSFLSSRPGAVSEVNDGSSNTAVLRVKKVAADIEMASLKRENQRLKALIERLSSSTVRSKAPALVEEAKQIRSKVPQPEFEHTARVLALLLEHLSSKDLGIVCNPDLGEIYDDAEEGPSRIIAASPQTNAFFDWLAKHASRRGTID